jgi:N-acetylglucosaminyldiphosphoundecaprenol N-acetyl-beta-D-mannosaminyltransferase
MNKHQKIRNFSQKSKSIQIKKIDKSVEIFGVSIVGTHKSQVLNKMWFQRKEMLHIATVNPEYIMEARTNAKFKEILAHCLTIADGWGVVWALRLTQGRQIDRISGVELAEEILKHANEYSEKVFLLGARVGIAEKAAFSMGKIYPKIQFAWYEGAQTVKVEKNEEASMTIAKINGFEPDYLLVAYGSPWQDMWIEENRPYLRTRIAVGVGGTLDEWAGVVTGSPAFIDRLGLKWFWRFVHEPWRWRRIIKVLQFGALVLYHKLID